MACHLDGLRAHETHLLSASSSSFNASVWNLLSHRYSEVLMGLKGLQGSRCGDGEQQAAAAAAAAAAS